MKMSSTRELARFGRCVAALVALAAVSWIPVAPARAATDAEQAEALIREGVRLRGEDRAALALPVFEKAYQISRTPRTAAQLALCELELGYYAEAERYLTEALAAPDHPWIAKNKTTLKRSLEAARANVGELVMTVSPADAEVLLNRKPIDRAQIGAVIRLSKGPVDVQVRATGHETTAETITIVGGRREQRRYALTAAPARLAALPTNAAASSGSSESTVPPLAPVTLTASASDAEASGPSKARIAAWVTGAAAAGALVLGTVQALQAANRSDAFNNHTGVLNGVVYQDCGTTNLSGACQALKNEYDQALTLSIVGFVAAGALAATSAVLFVMTAPGRNGGAEQGVAARGLTCVPDLGARGIGCALRF
jgi:hypothetical protein